MSRSLDDLHPEIRWRAKDVQKAAEEISIPILIYNTLRTFAEQEALYEIGRSKPGKIVTWAEPGQSYHNYGLAFDFVPVGPHSAPQWDDLEGFRIVGEIGEGLGLQWGGRWPKLKDSPHFQMTFGLSVDLCRQLYDVGGIPAVWTEATTRYQERLWP